MKVVSVLVMAVAASLATAACDKPPLKPINGPVPEWVQQQILAGGEYPPVVLHVAYDGRPAYQTTATDRADTGDEHGLFSTDGKLICRFGGWSPKVSSGACKVNKIIYMGTLYEPEFTKRAGERMPPIGSPLWNSR